MHGKYGISPVIGCSHGCVYCYMKDIALKFKNHKDINGEQIFNTYTDWCKPIMVSNYWELVHKLIDHLHKIHVSKEDTVDVINNTLIITDNLNHIYWIDIEHINSIIFNIN